MPKTTRYEEVRRARVTLAPLVACALLLAAPCSRSAFGATQRQAPAQRRTQAAPAVRVPEETLLRIIEAEDERRWDDADLGKLLTDASAAVRRRAALAAGRIGDEGAVASLSAMLRGDRDESVRTMAAFAIGEIEAESGAEAPGEGLEVSRGAGGGGALVEA